jgi:hypothetical protein
VAVAGTAAAGSVFATVVTAAHSHSVAPLPGRLSPAAVPLLCEPAEGGQLASPEAWPQHQSSAQPQAQASQAAPQTWGNPQPWGNAQPQGNHQPQQSHMAQQNPQAQRNSQAAQAKQA